MTFLDLTKEDLASHIALLRYVGAEATSNATIIANKPHQTEAHRTVLRRCLDLQGMVQEEIARQETTE